MVGIGIRNFNPKLRNAAERLEQLRTPEGPATPTNTLAELRCDLARLRFVAEQARAIDNTRLDALRQAAHDGPHAMVVLLAQIIGVGIETADMLVNEVLGRRLRDRRAVARYAGLTGSPDESGAKSRKRGRQGGQLSSAARNAPTGPALAVFQKPVRWRNGTMFGRLTPRQKLARQ